MYGFLISYKCQRVGLKDNNLFKIFTMNSVIDDIETAEKFYLDGKLIKVCDLTPSDPSDPNDVEKVLMANVDSSINGTADKAAEYAHFASYNQVIRYRLNIKGEIDKIDTIQPDTEEGSLNKYAEKGDGTRYYNSVQSAFGTTKVDFMIDNNTLLLLVPNIEKRGDAKNYLVTSAMDYLVNGTSMSIEAYDFSDDTMTVKLLVSYDAPIGSSISYRTRVTLVDRIVTVQNENEEQVGKLYGIRANLGIEKTAANSTVLNGIKQGDIIKFAEDVRGNIIAVDKLFSPDSAPAIITSAAYGGSNAGLYYDSDKHMFGLLCKKVGNIIVLSTKLGDTNNEVPYEDAHLYNVKGARVWIYDEERRRIAEGSIEDLNDAVYANDPSARVYLCSNTGVVRDVFIIKMK